MKPIDLFKLFICLLIANFGMSQSTPVVTNLFAVKPTPVHMRNAVVTSQTTLSIDPTLLKNLRNHPLSALTLSVPTEDGKSMELNLHQTNPFTADFKVTLSDGKLMDFDKGIHYYGTLKDDPTSLVSISIFNNQIAGLIATNQGNYNLGKLRNSDTYVLFKDSDIIQRRTFDCQFKDEAHDYIMPQNSEVYSRIAKTINSSIEADYDMFQLLTSEQNVLQYVTICFTQGNIILQKESIDMQVKEIKIWNTPSPYNPGPDGDTGLYLESFVQKSTLQSDLGHLYTFQDINGGLAAGIGTLCTNNNKFVCQQFGDVEDHPTYSWDAVTWVHEAGHVIGSYHTHACKWNGNNTQIDDCGNYVFFDQGIEPEGSSCFNSQNLKYPTSGGFVMSYCDKIQNIGINVTAGFGQQSGNAIRAGLAKATCIAGNASAFTVDPTSYEFGAEAECKDFNVTSTIAWDAFLDPTTNDPFKDLISGTQNSSIEYSNTKEDGLVRICVNKNKYPFKRSMQLIIWDTTTFDILAQIPISQIGSPSTALFANDYIIIPFDVNENDRRLATKILSNTAWNIELENAYDAAWINIESSKVLSSSNESVTDLVLSFKKNSSPLNRYGRIKLSYNGNVSYFTVTQPGAFSGYLNIPEEIYFNSFVDDYNGSFALFSDVEWEYVPGAEFSSPWIEIDEKSKKGKGDALINYKVRDAYKVVKPGKVTFRSTTDGIKLEKVIIFREDLSAIQPKVYPNPTSQDFTFKIQTDLDGETLNLALFSTSGKLVKVLESNKRVSGEFNWTYSVNDLPAGMYCLRYATKHQSGVIKLQVLN